MLIFISTENLILSEDGIQLWFLNLFWCWFFFQMLMYPFSFDIWGPISFRGFLMPHEFHLCWWGFSLEILWPTDHFFIIFQVFFFSFGCSCWVSTMICLCGCWREMKELVHSLLSSQNLDTSPEARTVWSKFSILFEVFWLISIHKWTKVPNRFWLRFWRLIGWFFLPKWPKNVNYKIINHK
jgi:hypothetical protein